MKALKTLLDAIEAVQDLLVKISYVLIIAIVSFQVLNRFWLHWSITWTADSAVITFIWLAFISASTAVRKRSHFRMQAVVDAMGTGLVRRVLELFALLVMLLIMGTLLYQGAILTEEGLREISPGIGLSMFWAYGVVPLTSATAVLFIVEAFVQEIQALAQWAQARPRRVK